MKQYLKWTLMLSILMIVCCLFPSIVHAQPGGPGGDPDVTVPVDGGLRILAVAGVAYGVKKIKEFRKKSGK